MSRDDCCNSGVAVLSFLAGTVVGAAIALLTAPKTGQETREMLVEYGSDLREKAGHWPEEVKSRGEDMLERSKEMIERGKELISRGSELAAQGKDFLDDKKKALSEAIEAGKEAMEQEREALARKLGTEED